MVTKEKTSAIQLSWLQVWTLLTVIGGLLGTMYAAGIKTESEVKKVALLKQEQGFQKQLSEVNVKLRTVSEDAEFFKDRYIVTKERLTNCIKKETFIREGFDATNKTE
jgi:hypothetical protein